MQSLKDDTALVKREYEALSTSTQVFVWALVGLGVLLGLILGGAVGYGVAVEEVDGQECIEHDGQLYCLENGGETEG